MPIVTPAQFRTSYPALTGTGEDAKLEILIERADQMLATYCGFKPNDAGDTTLQESTYTDQKCSANPLILDTDVRPVTSVATVHQSSDWLWDSSTLVDSSEYLTWKEDGEIELVPGSVTSWYSSRKSQKIVYLAGYATAPNWLVQAVCLMVRHLLDLGATQGITAINQGGVNESREPQATVPPLVAGAIWPAKMLGGSYA